MTKLSKELVPFLSTKLTLVHFAVEKCVNINVNLNTASEYVLQNISGLNRKLAKKIVDFRSSQGPFASREDLLRVSGISPTIFAQAVGFLQIPDGENPLDRTCVHPESYELAEKLLAAVGFTSKDLIDPKTQDDL